MRQEDVLDFVRSRYPEYVSAAEVMEAFRSRSSRSTRTDMVTMTRSKLEKLTKYGHVERLHSGGRSVLYRWVPDEEGAES